MPRNAAGVYTLPLPPVTPNTVIESDWANATMDDIAATLQDSLSRSGQGGMLGAFRVVDGNVATPGLAFVAETSSGLYRISSGDVGMSVLGVLKQQWTNNGIVVSGTAALQGDVTITGAISVTGGITGGVTVDTLTVTGVSTFNGAVNTVGKLTTAVSTTTQAGFNIPHGINPTTPVNGDAWTTTSNLLLRINGINRTVAWANSAQTFTGAQIFSGTFAANGGVTLGDAAGDALTINSSTATIPNGLTFTGGTVTIPTLAATSITGTTSFTGAVTFSNGVTLGDVAGDALTINSNTASIPNHLNFTGGSIGLGMAPVNTTTATTIDIANATQSWINLYVAGTRKAFFSATGNSTALGTHDAFPLYFLTTNIGRQIIAADGNVVFGVGGTTTNYGAGFLSVGINASTSPVFDLKVGDVRQASYSATTASAILGTNANTPLVFITNGTEKARIDVSGNMLISGQSVAGGASFISVQNTQTGLTGAMNMVGSTFATGGVLPSSFLVSTGAGNTNMSVGQYLTGTGSLLLHTNGAERMRITAAGDTGFGHTPPNYGAGARVVSIDASINSIIDMFAAGVRQSSYSVLTTKTIFGTITATPLEIWTNSLVRMTIESTGKMGINGVSTTSAQVQLHQAPADNGLALVSATDGPGVSLLCQRAGITGGSITFRLVATVAGSITHPTLTTTAYNTSSDARLKRNVRPAKDVGRIIDNIPVVSFDWKTDGIHVPVGMIAQDVHGVFPQAVHEGGSDVDKDPWQLDHSKLVPVLLKEIQSLRQRVAVLEEA